MSLLSASLSPKQKLPTAGSAGTDFAVFALSLRSLHDRDMRKGTFYKTSSGNAITLQQSHEYLERGCMSNPAIFSQVATYAHSRQFL